MSDMSGNEASSEENVRDGDKNVRGLLATLGINKSPAVRVSWAGSVSCSSHATIAVTCNAIGFLGSFPCSSHS